MRYVSIDIETTGLNPNEGSMLSFGAVIEDTTNLLPLEELSKFHVYIKNPEPLQGNHYALQMNSEILKAIATGETDIPIIPPELLEYQFACFLNENSFYAKDDETTHLTITVAGKNFANFDERFIEKLNWKEWIRIRKRVLDPGTLFTNFIYDEVPPDLKTCKERAGISGEVTHDALQDALDVIAVLRTKY